MLGDILMLVGEQLNEFIKNKLGERGASKQVHFFNPASNDGSFFFAGDGVYLSLINIEQELSLRQGYVESRVVNNGSQDAIQSVQPAVNINLHLLFAANYARDYKTEINSIYWTMAFFQNKPVFNLQNTPGLAECGLVGSDKLQFELNTLPLKEMHYIWGNLGLKQIPSVTYQVKMLRIQSTGETNRGGVINDIELVGK